MWNTFVFVYNRVMKIFVSGQIEDVEYIRFVQDTFKKAGHVITHDWTRNETGDKMLGGQQAKFDNPEEARRRATNDLQGVIDSDVYVICTSNEQPGKGMYVELGGALALASTTSSPRVYLLGDKKHASIFYFHPTVIWASSVRDIIKDLRPEGR